MIDVLAQADTGAGFNILQSLQSGFTPFASYLPQLLGALPAYLPNVIAALLVFIVAAAVAGAVGAMVHRTMGDTPTGKVVRAAVPVLIMARRCS
jgi:hypothetical protein